MKQEFHLEAFEERKETIFKWGIEVRGIENSQRIVGDNASKAIVDLLSAYLHKEKKIDEGFQINHSWFKTDRVMARLPEFERKRLVLGRMMELEKNCEVLSYGTPRTVEQIKEALGLFRELERLLKEMME